jgi:uncharacterized protein DUF1565
VNAARAQIRGNLITNNMIVDLGGGPLGSRGRNRFVRNPRLDISAGNANATTAPIVVDAANNYWGGGPPAMPADVAPAMSSSTPGPT